MMKKALCILLSALILLSINCAYANANSANNNDRRVYLYDSDELVRQHAQALESILSNQKNVTVNNKVYIKLVYDMADGTTRTVAAEPVAFTATYQYCVIRTLSNEFVGGYVALGDYPKLAVVDTPYNLGVVLTKVSAPVYNSVAGHLTNYDVTITGGLFTASYVSTIYYDVEGNVKGTERTTTQYAYYYKKTGLTDF